MLILLELRELYALVHTKKATSPCHVIVYFLGRPLHELWGTPVRLVSDLPGKILSHFVSPRIISYGINMSAVVEWGREYKADHGMFRHERKMC